MSTALVPHKAQDKRARRIVTPEGVVLPVRLASGGERVAAFALDALIIGGVIFAIAMASACLLSLSGWGGTLLLLGTFLLRTFYFVFFEVRWKGQTPGKRALKIRVADGRGGALNSGALFVRNLTREMELFIPVLVLFVPGEFWPGASYGLQVAAAAWLFLFTFMPLLNRDRLRVGDLIAGTMVIKEPQLRLLDEVGTQARGRGEARYAFTGPQLDMYGIYELQVLESFLRNYPTNEAMRSVAQKISHKIAYDGPTWRDDVRRFLDDFYDALRARREQRMLLGDRQEHKKEGSLEDELG